MDANRPLRQPRSSRSIAARREIASREAARRVIAPLTALLLEPIARSPPSASGAVRPHDGSPLGVTRREDTARRMPRGKPWIHNQRPQAFHNQRPQAIAATGFPQPAATGHCSHRLSTTRTCTQTSGRSHGPRCNAAFQQSSKESSKARPWRRTGLYDE